MNDRPRKTLSLKIRSTSPYPVCKKKCTSYVGGKKSKTLSTSKAMPKATSKTPLMPNTLSKYNTINKERNKTMKVSDDVSKKYYRGKLQNPS